MLAVGDTAATNDTDLYDSLFCHVVVLLFIMNKMQPLIRLLPTFYRILQCFAMVLSWFLEVWWVAQNRRGAFGRNGG
jgi:hypothetical protein